MTAPTEPLLRYLHRLMRHSDSDVSDAALLERFVAQNDESAFAALLARHGPMVHGVCRRILHHCHDAEDAFQATFLVLARKAGSLRRPEALASWLYGIARHLAYKARRTDCRRRQREARCPQSAPSPSQGDLLDDLSARELLLALDEELSRLPETYRLPLILCQLEGRTQEEAARLLGWTPGSVKGRLERGRKQLHARLSRRGLTLSGAMLTLTALRSGSASAATRLTSATLRAALAFAAGSTRGIAANVTTLAQSGVTGMTITKAKMSLMVLFALALAGGAGVLAYPLRSEKQVEETQTTAAKAQERKIETSKPASEKAAPTDLYGDPLPAGAIARLGTVRFRHRGWRICDVLFSPSGDTLISAGDRSIELWDVHSGRRRRQIDFSQPYPYYLASIDLSPDGKLLVISRYEGKQMRFWDLDAGMEVHPFGDAAPAGRAVFSPSGGLLAALEAGNPRTVSIWDVRRGKKIRTIEGGEARASAVRSLAFSPDGKILAFPHDRGVRVWDLAAGKELHQLQCSARTPMGCVVFSSDGKLLTAASNPYEHGPDHAIHLWDVTTGKEVGLLKGHQSVATALAAAPKGNLLASASWDGSIRYWDLEKRQEVGRSPGPCRSYFSLRFSADGSVLASGEDTGAIRLWDARTHKEMAASAKDSLQWVRFAPDGRTLISTTWEQIGLWEPLTGRPRHIFDSKDLWDFHPFLSADGKFLATTSYWTQGQAYLWDAATGKLLRKFGESGQPGVFAVALSPDGRRLAGGWHTGMIRIWDTSSGKELLQLKGQQQLRSLAFAPDGAALASGSGDRNVRLWSLATGNEIWRKGTPFWTATDLQFSADGRALAVVGGMTGTLNDRGEVRLWESATGKELKRFEGHRDLVLCAAFSPDGRMLATGSRDNTIRLWEVASGSERQCLHGHQSRIVSISFSPDGRLLASASYDNSALVWDLTGRFRDGRFQQRSLSAEELNRCWVDLAVTDAARAYQSLLALAGSPKEAIALLKERLPPLTIAEPKRVASLLAALDSDRFAERDKAMSDLEKMGLGVEPALHAALDAKPSLEQRRRIEAVLEKLAGGPRLHFARALEVVEHVATAEARQLVESLSQGSAELWPTQEAKAALARLAARAGLRP